MSLDNKNVYVGHRYVPKIFGTWNKLESYEGLSIVTWEGTSYTSKKRVPKGVDILNEEYWVVTGNYNAQVEQYRQDVKNLKSDVDDKFLDVENSFLDVDDKLLGISGEISEITVNLNKYAELSNNDNWTNAINTAISDNINPIILLATGDYKIDNLILKDNTVIKGSRGSKILLGDSVEINSLKNIVFEDIIFEGQDDLQGLYGFFNIFNSNHITFINCTIDGKDGSFTSGINALESENILIDRNNIKNLRSNKGISFIACKNSIISNNNITRTGRSAISLNHSNKNIKVLYNFMSENKINFDVTDGVIDLYGVSDEGKINEYIDIIGNYIEESGSIDSSAMLIRLKDSHKVIIEDNNFVTSKYTNRMIYVDVRGGLNCDQLSIVNNSFNNPNGMVCYNVLDVNDRIIGFNFTDNKITSNGVIESAVIVFRKNVDNILFKNNTIDVKGQSSRILYFNHGSLISNNVLISDNIFIAPHQIEFNQIYNLKFINNILNTDPYEFSPMNFNNCFFYLVGQNIVTGKKTNMAFSGGSGSSEYIRLDNVTNQLE